MLLRFAVLPLFIAGAHVTVAQTNTGPAAHPNSWMKTATSVAELKADQLSVGRIARDAFWDGIFQYVEPLTPENAENVQTSEGSVYRAEDSPAIANYPNRILVIGKFTTHRSVLSASHHCIYSEITMRLEEVLEPGNSPILAGDNIAVTLPGGSVTLQNGEIISFITQPRQFSLQPNHTYVLALTYNPNGDFYTVVESWDVSDGTVRPNSGLGVSRSRKQGANIVGLTRAQLAEKLKGSH